MPPRTLTQLSQSYSIERTLHPGVGKVYLHQQALRGLRMQTTTAEGHAATSPKQHLAPALRRPVGMLLRHCCPRRKLHRRSYLARMLGFIFQSDANRVASHFGPGSRCHQRRNRVRRSNPQARLVVPGQWPPTSHSGPRSCWNPRHNMKRRVSDQSIPHKQPPTAFRNPATCRSCFWAAIF